MTYSVDGSILKRDIATEEKSPEIKMLVKRNARQKVKRL